MSTTAAPQQSHSRDVALAAIAQAQRQIGHADEQLARAGRLVSWSLMGLGLWVLTDVSNSSRAPA